MVNTFSISGLVNPSSSAVLVIDLQNAYCSLNGSMANLGYDVAANNAILAKVSNFLEEARNNKVQVIFTRMIEDSKYMMPNARLKGIETVASPDSFDFSYVEVAPKDSDIEIIKNSYDAFSNPDLAKVLNDKKIENLIILGVNGDVCVDTTVRSAFTRGYNVIVPIDLVSTIREKLYRQESSIELWRLLFAHVVDSGTIIGSWVNQKD